MKTPCLTWLNLNLARLDKSGKMQPIQPGMPLKGQTRWLDRSRIWVAASKILLSDRHSWEREAASLPSHVRQAIFPASQTLILSLAL